MAANFSAYGSISGNPSNVDRAPTSLPYSISHRDLDANTYTVRAIPVSHPCHH